MMASFLLSYHLEKNKLNWALRVIKTCNAFNLKRKRQLMKELMEECVYIRVHIRLLAQLMVFCGCFLPHRLQPDSDAEVQLPPLFWYPNFYIPVLRNKSGKGCFSGGFTHFLCFLRQLWGVPHPAGAGLLAAEQPALRAAELQRLQPVHRHLRLQPEQLQLVLRPDPEQ